MSIQPIPCPECHEPGVFHGIGPIADDESIYGVVWNCEGCDEQVVDECPLGPLIPAEDSCLSCGAELSASQADPGSDGVRCGCGLTPAEADELLAVKFLPSDPVVSAGEAFAKGFFRHGHAILNKQLQVDPLDEGAWVHKATFLFTVQFKESHRHILEHMQSIGLSGALALEGSRLQNEGDFAAAAGAYAEFLRERPDHQLAPDTVLNLGVVLDEVGRGEEVEQICEAAIAREPSQPCHYANYSALLAQRKQLAKAVSVVDSGLAAVVGIPARIHLLEIRCMMLTDMQRGQDAVQTIEQAIVLGADSPRTHFFYGRALALVGQLDQASEQIRLVLRVEPNNAMAQQALQALESAMNQH